MGPWFEVWLGHHSLCLVLVKAMDVQLTWTDCDKAGDYVVIFSRENRDLPCYVILLFYCGTP